VIFFANYMSCHLLIEHLRRKVMTTLAHTFPTSTGLAIRWRRLAFATDGSTTQAVLRLAFGLVLLPHGAQHLLGAFGGYGFQGTVGWMTATLGIPTLLAQASVLLEFFGALLLIAGAGTRAVAAALAVFMATAASTHVANGFFMNWTAALPAGTEGFEYHLLAIAICVALAIRGGGAFALDRWLSHD
jgi:putative oxidoreductase